MLSVLLTPVLPLPRSFRSILKQKHLQKQGPQDKKRARQLQRVLDGSQIWMIKWQSNLVLITYSLIVTSRMWELGSELAFTALE